MAKVNLWRWLRTGLLVYLLFMVAVGAWLSRARTTDWQEPLWVTIFPINGDYSDESAAHIEGLKDEEFEGLDLFFQEEAEFYELAIDNPIRIEIGPELSESPPEPPASRNPVTVALWSLQLRWWVMMLDKAGTAPADIVVFVKYYDPESNPSLAHSLGLQKGLIGVVNAFASSSYAGSNNVVIAHELLHTVGASDKYDNRGEPIYPHGYAEPDLRPLYPQSHAELMGGRVPLTEHESKMPISLSSVVVGELTAREINWLE